MTAVLPPDLDHLVQNPRLSAFAPLLYVAWADGTLSDAEIRSLSGHARELEPPDRGTLEAWLDPSNPPSSSQLLRLLRFVRVEQGKLEASQRGGLADLGLEIAGLEGDDVESTERALRELESALGMRGSEVAREFFLPRPPVPQVFDEPTPTFDPHKVQTILDGRQATDLAKLRILLARPEFRVDPSLGVDARRECVRRWLKSLIAEGLGGLGFPDAHGGTGGPDRFLTTFEALGMFDLGLLVKYGVQFGLFGGAIARLGTERHHARWLPALTRGELMGGFAMTERGHGSNVRDIETVARYEHASGEFVLHTPSPSASKEWIGNAMDGHAMVVFAQLEVGGEEHGVHAFFVEVRDASGDHKAGVRTEDCGHKMGLNGVDNGRIWFDHVRVPREQLLDRYATVSEDGVYESPIPSPSRRFFTMLGTLVGGRVGVASAAMTASKTVLTIAVRYGALRRQFGPAGQREQSILDYPMHQRRLMLPLAATYGLHFALRRLQAQYLEEIEAPSRELECEAAGLKVIATWHAVEAAQNARECCGGQGFLSTNRIAEMRRDVDVFATFEGDNVVLLQLVAKSLLTGYAKSLSHDLWGTLLGQVRRSARVALLEKNPVTARRTDVAHLLDADFHTQALCFRTHNLLVSAARRMKKRTDAGMDSFDAFTEIQDHLTTLAIAHVEERIHRDFSEAVLAVESPAEREILERVRALYGLGRIHGAASYFLEDGYFEPSKARAIRKLMVLQCESVREHAVALVQAFGIPDEVVAAPIAFEGYAEAGMGFSVPA